MERSGVRTVITVLVGLVGLLGSVPPRVVAMPLKVAATIFPLYDLVRQVAGGETEVVLLVPLGASPHTVAFKPGMARQLAGSEALFAIGYGLDDWAVRLAAEAGVREVVQSHGGKRLPTEVQVEHHHSGSVGHDEKRSHRSGDVSGVATDPHYWLSIPNAMQMVSVITESLARLDPGGQTGYMQRAGDTLQAMQQVDRDIRRQLAALPRREIALFHGAFAYFAAAYQLHIVATFEPTPGREPGPRHVREFLRRIRDRHLRTLFIEPQLDATPLRALARDIGVELTLLDPLGGSAGREHYLAMMRFNAAQIATALRE
jgi:ABC-type Zn uptake system ZnuABC Zn-binding protein ZnuA